MSAYEEICLASDREKWLAERRLGIGGSDVAAILGLSPWRSPLSVYADKLGQLDSAANEATYWGSAIEPLVLKRFADETGRAVEPAQMLLRSIDCPFQLATLDGVQKLADPPERAVLEIKCTTLQSSWEDGPPPYVLAQFQHQLAVTGWQRGSVAALFNGREFHYWDLDRDQAFIDRMTEIEAEFWGHVELREPPPATALDKDTLARLYPESPGIVIDLGPEFDDLANEIVGLKKSEKDIELRLLTAENKLKLAIGEASMVRLPSGVCYTYKTQNKAEYIVKASSFRVLRRKEPK